MAKKPTVDEIYKINQDGLFESTSNWWDDSYKLSQAEINRDLYNRINSGGGGGGTPNLNRLLTSLNNSNIGLTAGYLHYTGSGWEFVTGKVDGGSGGIDETGLNDYLVNNGYIKRSNATWWGAKMDANNTVQGDMKYVSSLTFTPDDIAATGLANSSTKMDDTHKLITPAWLKGKVPTLDSEVTFEKLVTFLKGIKVGDKYYFNENGDIICNTIKSDNYNEDTQSGFGIVKKANGKYGLNITDLMVWGKAVFNELEIRKLSYVGGNIYLSGAGSKIMYVKEEDNAYKCYLLADDGTTATQNYWQRYDQAKCQTFNIKPGVYKDVSNKYYWRLVTAVSTTDEAITVNGTTLYDGKKFCWIKLSKSDYDGTDIPAAGDTIVLDGNRSTSSRQSVLMLESTGDGCPRIIGLSNIDSYSHEGKDVFIISANKCIFTNNYFELRSASGGQLNLINYRGIWSSKEVYYKNDQVSYKNSIWTCISTTPTTIEPTDDSDAWRKELSANVEAITITETSVGYALSDSNIEPPLTGWQDTPQTMTDEQPYLWTRTGVKYSDGSETISYSISTKEKQGEKGEKGDKGDKGDKGEQGIQGIPGKDGANGTSITIKGTFDSVNGLPSSGAVNGDCYIVGKDLWVYTGTSVEDSKHHNGFTNVGQIKGDDGAPGKSYYIHVAWCNTSDNSDNSFTVSNPNGTAYNYLGTLVDTNVADSANFKDYDWIYIRGAKGEKGDKGEKGQDGTNGEDGESALEIVIQPDTVVFDANENGVVDSTVSKDAKLILRKDGGYVANQYTVTVDEVSNCSATVIRNNYDFTIRITSIAKTTVNNITISATSGYAKLRIVHTDNTAYYATVKFGVNLSVTFRSLISTDKEFNSKYTTLKSSVDGYVDKVTTLTTDVSNLKQTSNNIRATVASLETTTGTLSSNLNSVQNAINRSTYYYEQSSDPWGNWSGGTEQTYSGAIWKYTGSSSMNLSDSTPGSDIIYPKHIYRWYGSTVFTGNGKWIDTTSADVVLSQLDITSNFISGLHNYFDSTTGKLLSNSGIMLTTNFASIFSDNFNDITGIISSGGFATTTDVNNVKTTLSASISSVDDKTGKLTDRVAAVELKVGDGGSEITLTADKITFDSYSFGYSNGNFKVDSSGYMTCKGATIGGTLNGVTGTFNEIKPSSGSSTCSISFNSTYGTTSIKGGLYIYNGGFTFDGSEYTAFNITGSSVYMYNSLAVAQGFSFGNLACLYTTGYTIYGYPKGFGKSSVIHSSVTTTSTIDGKSCRTIDVRDMSSGMNGNFRYNCFVINSVSSQNWRFINMVSGQMMLVINSTPATDHYLNTANGWTVLHGGQAVLLFKLTSSYYNGTISANSGGLFIISTYDNNW